MPQMMPLNWLMLMLFFILTFYLFNNFNYFSFNYTPKKNNLTKKNIYLIWKW
uniref:ATP synthase complex subunit 8 n=1 Tax=Dibolia occultans TaxID=1425563 RepID=A0A3G1GP57_9CUCU|nr:ATP synthase F0 subunit 8 [Dibolia occultans]